jgi:ATP-dependent DNA ligase
MHLPVNPPVLPMLVKRVGALPSGGTWIFELKWDGFRALVFRDRMKFCFRAAMGNC